jgi:hypothetical protein
MQVKQSLVISGGKHYNDIWRASQILSHTSSPSMHVPVSRFRAELLPAIRRWVTGSGSCRSSAVLGKVVARAKTSDPCTLTRV